MSPTLGFILFLAVTLALLGAVVVTGLRARRSAHVKFVIGAVASLGVTIYFAEQLGELYDLASAGRITPIHLALAKATVVAYLLPVITGVMTWRSVRHKKMHARMAWTVLALTVATATTGVMMIAWSDPL